MGIAKRHFYVCAGETLSWQNNWYTQPWFTDYRQSYDRAASTGPVDPPLEVIQTVSACSRLLSSENGRLSDVLATQTGGLVTTEAVVGSRVSGGEVFRTTRTTVYTLPPTTTAMALTTGSITTMSIGSMITAMPSSVARTTSSSLASTASAQAAGVASVNACAGDMDWQAWGAIGSMAIGLVVGGLIWLLWAILRGNMPGLYSARTWFVPPESRPSRPWSLLALLLPFLHLPSLSGTTPLSEGHLALHSMLAALKLAAVSSLLALTAALPMFMAGVPCLSATSPSNNLGGRLGSLTDMSILRLLNSLDPSPGSALTSNQLHLQPYIRALPSTIAPAIDSARTRLIVLLVIIAVLGCGGGLFIIFRTYTAFARYRKRFERETCGGLEMVIVPAASALAWKGLSEEGIKKWLEKRKEGTELDIVGVFGVPDTSEWRGKLKERDKVLKKLEEAEVRYIRSFRLVPTSSNGRRLESVSEEDTSKHPGETDGTPKDYLAPKEYYKISSARPLDGSHERLDIPTPKTPKTPNPPNPDTKFREVNRDSTVLGRLSIGQRVRVDSMGQFVPDISPDSEGSNPLATPSSEHARNGMLNEPQLFAPTAPSSPRHLPLPPSPEGSPGVIPDVQPGPERQAVLHPPATAAAIVSARPSQESSAVGRHYSDIREQRALFKQLNEEIGQSQQKAFGQAAKGEQVRGWLVIGKEVRYLPGARVVEGATREDILWENVGKSSGETVFWITLVLLALLVAAIMIPIVGLSVATAPGFAHYLGFLRPLAESDGFGSGMAQGFVPALAITLVIGLAVFAITRFARQTKVVSRTGQRSLAFQATFYFTLFTTLLWLLTAIALEFAVQSFNLDVQEGRSTGDGSVFSTWLIFIIMLNIAVIVPGLYLLQPKRLWRYMRKARTLTTPRQRFRQRLPPSFNPSWALLPFLIAVFYAFSLLFLFPLLAIPILVLIFLSLVANRYMVDHVLAERVGYSAASIGLWTIRRFGWVLGTQPALLGLILLSRREWALGGTSIAVAVVTVILSEILTARRYRKPKRTRLSQQRRAALDKIDKEISHTDDDSFTGGPTLRTRVSDSSMLRRVAALLPGYSRLPADCPLPLPTEELDDLFYTEKASFARPTFAKDHSDRRYFHDPAESSRGLVYPSEMLAPVPVIWLPNDRAGVATSEAADLESYHGLMAIVDPEEPDKEKKNVR